MPTQEPTPQSHPAPDEPDRTASRLLRARAEARRALREVLLRLEIAARTTEGVPPELEAEYRARLADLRGAEAALRAALAARHAQGAPTAEPDETAAPHRE